MKAKSERRRFLSRYDLTRWPVFASTVALLLLGGWRSIPNARADDLSRADKLRMLYGNQLPFDRRGVPIISIAVAEGLQQVVLESDQPLRILPDGEDGAEVQGGRRWRITLTQAKPAVLEHYVVLDSASPNRLADVQRAAAGWRARGVELRLIETGTVFGVHGQVFDNRALILAEGPWRTHAEAKRRAVKRAQSAHRAKLGTLAQLKQRPSGTLTVADVDGAVRIRAADAVWFVPTSGAMLAVRVNDEAPHPYWGQLYVTVDRLGHLAVVNAVPADKLLEGLVPAEIFPSSPSAALKAQAVAARGDLLAKIGTRHLSDPYQICSQQHCQVYRGAGSEHPATTAAVRATRGQVLVRPDGSLVKALYSAHCGGHTEDVDQVWPVEPDPTLRGSFDAAPGAIDAAFAKGITAANIEAWIAKRPQSWCARSGMNQDKLRWSKRLSVSELNQALRPLRIGPLRSIEVLARGRSGRVTRLRVHGAVGSAEVRGELRIRKLFDGLRSSMFVVHPVRDANGALTAITFVGGGWGHGVGMCQTGAIGMAKGGKSFQAILQHYYSSSRLRRVY